MKTYFRFIKNHRIDLRDAVDYMPDVAFQEKEVPHLLPRKAVIAVFDIGPTSRPHGVELHDESLNLPPDFDKLPKAIQMAVEAQEVERAMKARERNADVRAALKFYADQGVIELVDEVA